MPGSAYLVLLAHQSPSLHAAEKLCMHKSLASLQTLG
jgi:hypothetical protein